ncbi:MAG: S8 family serine peptidase [Steroidobacteraceae bacterium]
MAKIDDALASATGSVDVVVQLAGAPLAIANGENAKRVGGKLSRGQQIAHSEQLRARQSETLSRILALGGQEIARVRVAYNAVIVRIDAQKLREVATLPGVTTLRPVGDYRRDLEDTVPYIGASSAQAVGLDGFGVEVAVLDSGIDYTHRNFGGAGTLAAYAAAYGASTADPKNTTLDGLFPTAKVVRGFDFVGEVWPTGPLAPDPDPIDFGAHGTHVADIIGGKSLDGTHVGVAPGVKLWAVKVCSAVSTSCSGVALLQAMDFALDPNGDGCMDDAADVINMSLGSSYGQREDDLSFASTNAVKAGVIVVASAGNSADRPYVTGSPSSTPEVISVAQTHVPSATSISLVINSPANIAGMYPNTATVSWAPIGAGFTGNVAFIGRGCRDDETTAEVEPTDLYLADPAGKVALIDRGACAVSVKVDRAAKAGAIGVLLGLVAAGDPISFSQGGGDTFVPTLVIIQANANLIKANLAAPVNVTVSPANALSLIGSMVGSSSRGPNHSFGHIKPDIGAPGASLSAEAGTGDGETAFGGTSGAAPMVSGAAAIMVQAYPRRSPAVIKSLLMNTADTQILINPATLPGVLSPITRIGGGEVRVDEALATTTGAWDNQRRTASLSFGYHALHEEQTVHRAVRVRNFSSQARTYEVSSAFRYATDAATGAVTVDVPSTITVPSNSSAVFDVDVTIDPSKLPVWNLNGGSQGGNGARLTTLEYDGYISIKDDRDDVHVAWQVLPHRAAEVRAVNRTVVIPQGENGLLTLQNLSDVLDGRVDVFSWTGSSPRIPNSELPGAGDNAAVIDLASVGARLVNFGGNVAGSPWGVQVAINTHGQRAHPAYPAEFDVEFNTDADPEPDAVAFTVENGGFAATGQTVVAAGPLPSGPFQVFFFADADLNSANMIMTIPLGLIGAAPNTQMSFSVLAFDNYFTGVLTDSIEGMAFTLNTPRFAVAGAPATGVPANGSSVLTVTPVTGGDAASPSDKGLLLLYRDGRARKEAETINVKLKNKK